MKTKFGIVTFCLFFVANIPCSANADNPLTKSSTLRNALLKIWYQNQYDIIITLSDDEGYVENIRYFNLRGKTQDGNEFIFTNPEMYKIAKDWNIVSDFGFNLPNMWEMPISVQECCLREFQNVKEQNITQILLARRRLDIDSVEVSEWNEGNVEYAQAKGKYYFDNYYSGEVNSEANPYEFRILIERNPASDGWVLSTYRGEESYYDRSDTFGLYNALKNRQ